MGRSNMKKSAIIIIAIVLCLITGAINGFPWEHIIATSRAKRYVIEKYQFTPTRAKYHLSIVDGSQRVSLYNKEFNFSFSVSVGRILPISKMSDNYLERLSEYYLAKELNDYVNEITNDKGRAYISLTIGRIHDFTFSEFGENQKICFEKLQGDYWCRIIF